MMNSLPNFDRNNPREYPTYENAPTPKGNDSTLQRIVYCFNAKVIIWAVLTILVTWAFFERPFVSSLHANLSSDWLFFAGGLILTLSEGILRQKRRTTKRIPLWFRILLMIVFLVSGFFAYQFLAVNNFFFSLCEGGIVGIGIGFVITAYRKAWEASS